MASVRLATRFIGVTAALYALFATGSGCGSGGAANPGAGGAGGVGGHGGSASQGGGGAGGGGPECTAATVAQDCGASSDCHTFSCESGSCNATPWAKNAPCKDAPGDEVCDGKGECVPPSCTDGGLNGKETDVDCGGADCGACDNGKLCAGGVDCLHSRSAAPKRRSFPADRHLRAAVGGRRRRLGELGEAERELA